MNITWWPGSVFLTVGCLCLTLIGCGEGGGTTEPPEPDVILAENTFVVDDADSVWLDWADSTTVVLRYEGSPPDLISGGILVGSEQGGFLREIVSSTVMDSILVVETQAASLSGAIEKGTVSLSLLLESGGDGILRSISDAQLREALSGVSLADGGIDLSGVILHEQDDFQVVVPEGYIRFSPLFDFRCDFLSGVKEMHATAAGSLYVELSIDAVAVAEISEPETDVQIAEIVFPGVPLSGPFPINADIALRFSVGIEATLPVCDIQHGMEEQAEMTMGASYVRGSGWSEIWERQISVISTEVDWEPQSGEELTAYVKAVVVMETYAVEGPTLVAQPYISLSAISSTGEWQWERAGGISGELAFAVSAFGQEVADYTKTLDALTIDIASGSWDEPEGDQTPPGRVTDLVARVATPSSVDLAWSAPGSDGMLGRAHLYDLRFDVEPITEESWASATEFEGESPAGEPGSQESVLVTGLDPNTTYYFALRVSDLASNWSYISNVLSVAIPESGYVYIVNPNGNAAFPTIQAAIDAVSPGVTIELADGTYAGAGNRDISYRGKAVTLRSESRDPETCIVDCEAEGRGFCFMSGEGPASVLEAVTITNASAGTSAGGGVYCAGSSPTISNLILRSNSAYDGGGMCCTDGSSPILTDLEFQDNSVERHGGGLYCEESSPPLERCEFSGNQARQFGGGIYCVESALTLSDVGFSDNSAGDHGGGMDCGQSTPILVNVTFTGNSSENWGGGGFFSWESSPTFTHVLFENNSADDGAALSCRGGLPTLNHVTFSENSGNVMDCKKSTLTLTDVSFAVNSGRGLVCRDECSATLTRVVFSENSGGGMTCQSSSATITDCEFLENSGNWGSGLYCSGSTPSLAGCVFWRNSAGSYGGAISCDRASPTLENVTFVGNSAPQGSSIYGLDTSLPVLDLTVVAFGTGGEAIECEEGSGAFLTCCDVFGNAGGDWVGYIAGQLGADGNISDDPLFCDAENGNFGLRSHSPCAPDGSCALIGARSVGCDTH